MRKLGIWGWSILIGKKHLLLCPDIDFLLAQLLLFHYSNTRGADVVMFRPLLWSFPSFIHHDHTKVAYCILDCLCLRWARPDPHYILDGRDILRSSRLQQQPTKA